MGSSTAPNEPEVIRYRHALFGGEAAERKAGGGFGVAGFESDRELDLDGDIEQDVEELGALLHRQEVSGEVGWFDPQLIARSTWARHSRRTSSMSAWSQRSSGVRGNPPSPSRRLGAWVSGAQRKLSSSALRVRWMPTSRSSALARWSAAWRAHGPVIISVAVVAQPSRRALRPAAVAACVDPMRSADRIRSRSSLLWPSACASEVTLRR